jgi:alkanesulfonate monooxygenase SsuD/methylene tetrahydromethanopterin reductase-like flavin-dependent oxidoreductase (luciferase family)
MKFGLFYLFSDFGTTAQDRLFHEVLEEITYAEELGFESVWLPEHHFAIYGMLGNPMIFAASVAARTRRIKIGTAIMVVPFQHPLRIAEDAALVDALSQGRLLLGLGRGYQPPEFEGFGLDQSVSREMFQEGFEIIRRALSGEKFAHAGRFWQFRDAIEIYPKPIQRPHPPFYLAAISPAAYDLAARLGISLLRSPTFTDLDTVTRAFEAYRGTMRAYGHDADALDQPFLVRTYVAPTDGEAKAETRHVVWYYHLLGSLVPGAPSLPQPGSYEAYPDASRRLAAVTEDEVWERGSCFGSPERVAHMLKRYIRRTGMNHLALEMRIGGLEHKKVMRSMELFAREVMPEVRAEAQASATTGRLAEVAHADG